MEGKRSGKWLKKKGKKRDEKEKIFFMVLNVKIKDKLLFCILNYNKREWIRRDK